MVHGLHETRHGYTASRFEQKRQFVQIFVSALTALLFRGHGNQDSPFGDFFVCDEVSHVSLAVGCWLLAIGMCQQPKAKSQS
jgi:hypothetical protein